MSYRGGYLPPDLPYQDALRRAERAEARAILADLQQRAEADHQARAAATRLPARLLAVVVGAPAVAVGLGLLEIGQPVAALGVALAGGVAAWRLWLEGEARA